MNAQPKVRRSRADVLVALLGTLAAVALASGCGDAHAREDHDHLEHHVPPHKPANLAAAIEQIDQRFAALQRRPHQASAKSAQQWQELLDIVRWLPEIAGDSDLPEAEWNVVNRVSQELTPLVERHCAQAAAAQPLAPAALAKSIGQATQELRKLAAPSANSPEHRHD